MQKNFINGNFNVAFIEANMVRAKYNKQRYICVSLVKKAKRDYYENLDLKDLSDNRKFWAIVKPLFSNKIKPAENIFR